MPEGVLPNVTFVSLGTGQFTVTVPVASPLSAIISLGEKEKEVTTIGVVDAHCARAAETRIDATRRTSDTARPVARCRVSPAPEREWAAAHAPSLKTNWSEWQDPAD